LSPRMLESICSSFMRISPMGGTWIKAYSMER
jgi:hypothetical protein